MAGDSVTTNGPRGVPTTLRTDDVGAAENAGAPATTAKALEAPPTTRVAVDGGSSVQQTRSTGGSAVEVFRRRRGRVRQPKLQVPLVRTTAHAVRAFQGFMADVSGMLSAYRGIA